MSKSYLIVIVSLMCSILASESMAGKDGALNYNGPSFKAQMKVSNLNNSGMSEKSSIWMSKNGLRVVTKGPSGQKMIMLTKLNETFMIFPALKKFISASEMEQQADNTRQDSQSNLFSNKPCAGFPRSKKSSATKVSGRIVTKWYCGKKKGLDDTVQFYDTGLRIVTKVRQPNGAVMELTNIEQKLLDKKLFELPAGYQKMTFAQMMMPPGMKLEPFVEEENKNNHNK